MFSVFFPKSNEASPIRGTKRRGECNGDETILVIDDDLSIRRILCRALQQQGYKVLEANDGDEGLDMYDANQEQIHLVILDILMPRMSGWEVLDAIKTRGNPPPVIVQTGFTGGERNNLEGDVDGFLRKPYDLMELMASVRDVLDRGAN